MNIENIIPVIATGLRKTIGKANKHAPTIFAGCALGCLCGAVITTATGMHKADQLVAEEEKRREEALPEYDNKELTLKDKVELTWKEFVPAGLFTAATAAFIVASERTGHERYIALMGAYQLSRQALDERKDAESDVLTEDDVKLIDKRAGEMRANAAVTQTSNVQHVTDDGGEILYVESVTATPFYAKENDVLHAFNRINHVRNSGDSVSLSEFLADLGLRESLASDEYGWHPEYGGSLIEPVFEPVFIDGDANRPGVLIRYSIEPKPGKGEDYVQY